MTGPPGHGASPVVDGKASTVPGPPGPMGPAGQSIRGEQGPPGPDSAAVLADVTRQLVELRAQVAPLTTELHKYLEAKKKAEEYNASLRAAVTERIRNRRG